MVVDGGGVRSNVGGGDRTGNPGGPLANALLYKKDLSLSIAGYTL